MATNEIINNNGETQFFEGVEKLLEIWFATGTHDANLRKIPRKTLEAILKVARCEIITVITNSEIDAYLLSESSMFISKNRFILKTCGTTTPLLCLPSLLLAVERYTGYKKIKDIFYSRKNYKHPELQIGPHQNFEKEVALLGDIFSGGLGYRFGRSDNDCWYLYRLYCPEDRNIDNRIRYCNQDQTLEILMFNLDPKIMSIFTHENCSDGPSATIRSGIDKIIPGMVIDSFLFEPCGYSMNGITTDGYYMTIHVTPETKFSYVSFETNIPLDTFHDIIGKILNVFHPHKFIITLIRNNNGLKSQAKNEIPNWSSIKNWNRHDVQYQDSQNYEIMYALYSDLPS